MTDECKRLEARVDELQKNNVALMRTKNELKDICQYLEEVFNEVKHSKKCLEETCTTILSDPDWFIDSTKDNDLTEVIPIESCQAKLINVPAPGYYDAQICQNMGISTWSSREGKNLELYINENSNTVSHFVKDEFQLLNNNVKNYDPHQQVCVSLCNPQNEQDDEAVQEIVEFLKSDKHCFAATQETFQNTNEDDNSLPAVSDSDVLDICNQMYSPSPEDVSTSSSPEDTSYSPSPPSSPSSNQHEVRVEETEASTNNNLNSVFVSTAREKTTQLEEEDQYKNILSSVRWSSKDDQSLPLISKQGYFFYSENEKNEATKKPIEICELFDNNFPLVISGTDKIVMIGKSRCTSDSGFDSDSCSDISCSPPDWKMNNESSKVHEAVRNTNSNTTSMTDNPNDIGICNCYSVPTTKQTRKIPIPEKNYRKRTSVGSMMPSNDIRYKTTRRECYKRFSGLSENRSDTRECEGVTPLLVNNENINTTHTHKEDVSSVSDALQKLTLTEDNSTSQSADDSNREVKNVTKESNKKNSLTTQKTNENNCVDTVLEKDLSNLQINTSDSNNNRTITTNAPKENRNNEINKEEESCHVKGDPVYKTDIELVLEITSQKQTSESCMERVKVLPEKTRNAFDNSNILDQVSAVGHKMKTLSLR